MKILYDSQIFDSQKYGGISRYFCELFKYLIKTPENKYILSIRDTKNEYLQKNQLFSGNVSYRKSIIPVYNFKLQRLLSNIWDFIDSGSNRNRTIKKLKGLKFDIFHPTYYSTYFLKYLKDKPFVLTVYDMTHEIYPKYFSLGHNIRIRQKKELILRASKIIAISGNTKKDIMRIYNIPENKINVIHLANSLEKTNSTPTNITNIPKQYILYVGSRHVYKNFIFFVNSIVPILNKDKSLNLVVAGGYSGKDKFSKEEIELFKKLNIINQVTQYSVDDETLAYLYQNALCFVFPSLYEGFGIPVLEAYACDCPAIISNTSSLPEVGGDAAMYFDPKSSKEILESVNKVIYDNNLRKEMITRGREQLKKFSWEKTATETIKTYSEVISSNI